MSEPEENICKNISPFRLGSNKTAQNAVLRQAKFYLRRQATAAAAQTPHLLRRRSKQVATVVGSDKTAQNEVLQQAKFYLRQQAVAAAAQTPHLLRCRSRQVAAVVN